MTDFVGAILAGGRGKRMGRLGDLYPKPLLPVANRPLIVHHVETLRAAGIHRIYVVVGHGSDRIKETLGDGRRHDVELRFIEQGAPLGSAHAVARLAAHIDGPFVLLLGDYYFSAPGLAHMLERARATDSSIMAAKREPDRLALTEACVLEVASDGLVRRIVEKPVAPKGDLKGCGIYVCRPEVLDAARRTPRTALRDEYELTVSLDVYLQMGFPLYAEEVIAWDMNFTRPEDVLQCNLIWLREHGRSDLVAASAQIASGSTLNGVVVGDNVIVSQATSMRSAVVFGGVQLHDGGRIEEALVTPSGLIDCHRA